MILSQASEIGSNDGTRTLSFVTVAPANRDVHTFYASKECCNNGFIACYLSCSKVQIQYIKHCAVQVVCSLKQICTIVLK